MTIVEAEKVTLASKNYSLEEELKKIDVFWATNDITQAERDELVALAKANVNPDADLPAYDSRISALELAVAEIQKKVEALAGESKTKEKFPLWVKPTSKAQYAHTGSTYSYDTDGDGTVEYYVCLLKKAQDETGDAYAPLTYKGHWKQVALTDDVEKIVADWKADEKNGYVTTSESTSTAEETTTAEENASTNTATDTATESTDATTGTVDMTTGTTESTSTAEEITTAEENASTNTATDTATESTDATTDTVDMTTTEK